jgi:hypothetical protein
MSDYMQGDKDSAVSVPFSDDETESPDKKQQELFDEAPASASPEERITRKQKQQARLQALLDEGKQSKEELAKVRSEQETLKQQLAEMRGFLAANQNAANQNARAPGKDEYEVRLDAVYLRQQEAYNAAQAEIKAGTFNEKRSEHYERIARELEKEKGQIHAERVVATRENQRRGEQAQQVWVSKYPDVYRDPRAYAYAEATFKQRVALGEQVSNDLVDQVMDETMTRFRLGPKKAPTASEKSRMSGIAAAGGGGSSSKGSGITMTPELTRIAVAAYSDLPEAEAIKKWVNGPGKRLRERKVI